MDILARDYNKHTFIRHESSVILTGMHDLTGRVHEGCEQAPVMQFPAVAEGDQALAGTQRDAREALPLLLCEVARDEVGGTEHQAAARGAELEQQAQIVG